MVRRARRRSRFANKRVIRGQRRSRRDRSLPVFQQQVATRGVGIDGAIQMASAVEVVGQAKRHVVSQVLLKRQVCLLRVGINKILGLRIAKGLEGHREKCCRVQIILVDEKVSVGRIKALLVRLVSRNRRQARVRGQNALKDVGGIQGPGRSGACRRTVLHGAPPANSNCPLFDPSEASPRKYSPSSG